ncbi:M90 family metallopeptidase [Nodularia sphaerocarpa]|uniref:M90 family metallopeptidase n=1 Tax=Nodularia sphaerocarpa TaxID=137816 RepID=UPI001EFB0FB4|nr:M90 family metallopeptidase [Nodularia sphaerocarpa]MDB9374374.1 zinc-dependent peptidase [Nodularia sphaerocarpa CS-585]MDB9378990.1 zinc-dependent peptidase [Nodularia sphaerocarpa CS-585A2]
MVAIISVFMIIGLIVIGILASPILIKQRRNRVKRRPFPPLWTAIIENHLPIYLQLSPDERRRLQGHIQIFLAEKQFIGCGGLQVTEEMKLTIAAVACLLLLNERGKYFPQLRTILIYPGTYFVNQTVATGNYVVQERREARLGESWTQDQVILSWEQVEQDTGNWKDGHNVVLHEFAHQLDQEDGTANGVPILPRNSDYAVWAQVMTAEYKQLCHDIPRKVKTVMDGYGTINPAEFFAVATETFYEKPRQLRQHHPALYEQLQRYYQLDPVQWT